ncbi:kinase-like domain-containing protein [Rhizophagus irregularis DAOM 181602=DAOM 197198]|uniref:Kinase-like domain-containing protein n=3 Tax=Rhizophagus irregularis (strain DAOM 181602 / DAOM 197198 / MUCL 43194) TaxID=747089 RepID=A0A2P4QLX2_RHIID|nr:kinase-like domain-containing protein [Rhizophagus irregularis DAOM 181602=DAOM 197198]POG78610.1 kinase-like domain-containing protein [Rhizophagus irregularis DAOM 181602=DAOM 197198]|eukprot:XP_025185476.1 kinase-like domain-containing protein [Rhizophagus irregularis DAOM 181602=DAOM 197198]
MDEIKLSDDVIEQIKDFNHRFLIEEQELLIDKLILNEELKELYKEYGLCNECKQPNIGHFYCKSCNFKRFHQNFKNWTSGNHDVDNFTQNTQLKARKFEEILEWIEHKSFINVKYLAEGGFGTVFKAIWEDGFIGSWDSEKNQWHRLMHKEVALKCLHNSQNITTEFLREIELLLILAANKSGRIIRCYGITKDPITNNFMIVMELKKGSLRQHLDKDFNSLDWKKKLYMLQVISFGLEDIHSNGFIHHDFHCGNILSDFNDKAFITDVGLCQPANMKISQEDNTFGVLPYVAPEVLRGGVYTQVSDIYAFGIVAYEICTGFPPYHNVPHDEFLALKICEGLRPESNYKIPNLIFDIINQCWDEDSLKRPNVVELRELFRKMYNDYNEDSVINKQIKEADEINSKSSSSTVKSPLLSTSTLSYTTHPQASYTSRLLSFKNLSKLKKTDDNSFELMRID